MQRKYIFNRNLLCHIIQKAHFFGTEQVNLLSLHLCLDFHLAETADCSRLWMRHLCSWLSIVVCNNALSLLRVSMWGFWKLKAIEAQSLVLPSKMNQPADCVDVICSMCKITISSYNTILCYNCWTEEASGMGGETSANFFQQTSWICTRSVNCLSLLFWGLKLTPSLV